MNCDCAIAVLLFLNLALAIAGLLAELWTPKPGKERTEDK